MSCPRVLFITVTDAKFFPGTVSTINSILRFHPEAHIRVIENDFANAGLSPAQREAIASAGAAVFGARAFEKPGRKLAAWELKAYAAADFTADGDALVGIDSDCLLCGPIDDIIEEALRTGRFHGGRDLDEDYDETFRVYGIEPPVRNEQYMSASLYVCPLTKANRSALQSWAQCCDRAIFGGSDLYPGHGDQGVLNAVLYAQRKGEAVALLENTLWSQHHCYWQHPLEIREGRLFNTVSQAFQRSLHCGGTKKFWTKDHFDLIKSRESQIANYAWFLACLWFGRCAVSPAMLGEEFGHLAEAMDTYRAEVTRLVG